MTVFWRKYNELCGIRNINPRKLAEELKISSATVTKWVNGGMPCLDILARISAYFDVPIEYFINDDDVPMIAEVSRKRNEFESVTSLSQRQTSFRRGDEVPLSIQLKILEYTGCSVQFLNNDRYINFEPADTSGSKSDSDTVFDILDILDRCADTDSYRTVQAQLSRIALYHLNEKGIDREKLRVNGLPQEKLNYLYLGIESSDKSRNYGLNFSEIYFLREFTGVGFEEMFCGKVGK
ncbi:MAG: helix-turn-helix transcriptional regulator [Ruminococcus sp.]|nr:helix-turn-helix transcriptional regulator [Ruminococcus sp.]